MTKIIDALTHLSTGMDDVIGWGPYFRAENLLVQMDSPRKVFGEPAPIDQAVAFPAFAITVPTSKLSFQEQHEYIIQSVDRYPDRFYGGAIVNPHIWNDEAATQLASWVEDHRFRMIYINPSLHKYWLPIKTPSESAGSRKLLFPIFEFARQYNLPVLIHTGEQPYALPATVDYIAGEFNDVNMIIAHLGTQGEVYTLESLLVAERHENVFMETSFSQVHMLIETVHTIGADRVIFGSNCPPLEPTQQLLMVEEALTLDPPVGMSLPIPDARKIMGGNLERLFAEVKTPVR